MVYKLTNYESSQNCIFLWLACCVNAQCTSSQCCAARWRRWRPSFRSNGWASWNGRPPRNGNWGRGGNWHGHHGHNNVIFIGDFGFPWWWGWGWGTGWGWDGGYGYYGGYPYGYGYPYGSGYGYNSYGYGDPYGYGYGYGNGGNQYGGDYGYGNGRGQYGQATHSRVAELQRRLARAGYYHGSVDGVLGPQTRRAIRAYERDHGYASN